MVHKVCEICQKEFEAVQRKEKYCNDECYKEARRRQSRTPEQRARKARNKADQRGRNPEHMRELVRKSQAKNREKHNADTREWYKAHPGYRREQSQKWRDLHPELKRQDTARYYQKYKEQVIARTNGYRRLHPEHAQARNSRRRARLLQATGTWTHAEFKALCEAVDWHCAYCLLKFDKLTPDHITPLSRGGSNDISNIIPACGPCNYSKQDKTPLEFLSRFVV